MQKFVRPINYVGLKTKLGPIHPEHDLPYLWKWINDPEVAKYTLASWPTHYYAEKDYVENLHKQTAHVVFAAETLDNHFIGLFGLHSINFINGTATTGALIGEKEYRGKGYGPDAKMHVLHHAFNVLGLRKICSAVKAFNAPSLKYLEKSGYQIEGPARKQMFWHEGEFHDEIFLCIYREDFLPRWKEYQRLLALAKSDSEDDILDL
jgi:RimJ/RimL family protein N-acetyltransferase